MVKATEAGTMVPRNKRKAIGCIMTSNWTDFVFFAWIPKDERCPYNSGLK
jgi:hypothetical protein